MAHAPRSTESHIQLPAAPAHWLPRASSTAFRAPLAERSAVNRQVLGSIPSGGVLFILFFTTPASLITPAFVCGEPRVAPDAMAQWQRVGFQIRRLGVRLPLASTRPYFCFEMCYPPGHRAPWPSRCTELDAMAQWQRVGFQIRRLGVRIPLASRSS